MQMLKRVPVHCSVDTFDQILKIVERWSGWWESCQTGSGAEPEYVNINIAKIAKLLEIQR